MSDSVPRSTLTYADRGSGVPVNLDRLVASRMLIQANSGGGKSRAIVNTTTRTARILYRGKLDLARTCLDLPWWVVKALASGIADVESQLERQGVPFPRVTPNGEVSTG